MDAVQTDRGARKTAGGDEIGLYNYETKKRQSTYNPENEATPTNKCHARSTGHIAALMLEDQRTVNSGSMTVYILAVSSACGDKRPVTI
ncbi:hypothetical protein EVAR_39680_1 [Eumeta japonica]|uniref:Uncharacterized protein n=1 Tax=Eumeta variegata TaxID=151549 RepID=A0A4C1Z2L3_EUMVA|nr:hypothetical protein EVAR_39680_1 [Eumeta japonica]